MANFSALKTAIQNAIKQNGNEEITGDVLQQILLSIVSTMGDGAINTIEQNLSSETLARQGADNNLQSNIDAEALARGNADTQLQNAINAIKSDIDNGYVYAGIATPTATPVSGKVFYIATAAGTYTNFGGQVLTQGINILRYNGSAWSHQQLIGIDDVPTAGSNNLVKSSGVQNEIALGAVYDVSAKNPTAGPNNDGKWESLSALLSDANLNTLIPTAYRKGGMSIKFVHTNDNNYAQYRLMSDTFNTTPANWQGTTNEITAGSKDMVESSGVKSYGSNLKEATFQQILPEIELSADTLMSGKYYAADHILKTDSSYSVALYEVSKFDLVKVKVKPGQYIDCIAYVEESNQNKCTPIISGIPSGASASSFMEVMVDCENHNYIAVTYISSSGLSNPSVFLYNTSPSETLIKRVSDAETEINNLKDTDILMNNNIGKNRSNISDLQFKVADNYRQIYPQTEVEGTSVTGKYYATDHKLKSGDGYNVEFYPINKLDVVYISCTKGDSLDSISYVNEVNQNTCVPIVSGGTGNIEINLICEDYNYIAITHLASRTPVFKKYTESDETLFSQVSFLESAFWKIPTDAVYCTEPRFGSLISKMHIENRDAAKTRGLWISALQGPKYNAIWFGYDNTPNKFYGAIVDGKTTIENDIFGTISIEYSEAFSTNWSASSYLDMFTEYVYYPLNGSISEILNIINPTYGSKILCIGDSITYGSGGHGTTWTGVVAELLHANVSTHAYPGIGIIAMVDGYNELLPALTSADVADKDYVLISGFYNDVYAANNNFGEETDMYPTQNTYLGKLNYAIDKIFAKLNQANNYKCKVVVVSAHRFGAYPYNIHTSYEQGEPLRLGAEKAAHYNSIHLIDLMHNAGINKYNWDVYQTEVKANPAYIAADGEPNGTNKPFATVADLPSSASDNMYATVGTVESYTLYKKVSGTWTSYTASQDRPYPWCGDQLHPSAEGYKRIGEYIAKQLLLI